MTRLRSAAAVLALVAWSAIGGQMIISSFFPLQGKGGLAGLVGLFGYFTIWTNFLVALVTTSLALHGPGGGRLTGPGALAATVVYIIIVGAVYNLVLASQWHPVGVYKLIDTLLHSVVPIAYPLLWLTLVDRGQLKARDALRWLAYPTAYLGVAMVRGATTGKYAYPFLDLTKLASLTVGRNIVLLFALFVLLSLVIIALDRGLGRMAQGTKIQPGE